MDHLLGLSPPSMNTLPSDIRVKLGFRQQTREAATGKAKETHLSVLHLLHFQQL